MTLTRLEQTYDKNLVLETRREYIKVQLELEECERRHQEIFNPNIGKPISMTVACYFIAQSLELLSPLFFLFLCRVLCSHWYHQG